MTTIEEHKRNVMEFIADINEKIRADVLKERRAMEKRKKKRL
jgi:hypothetical protein